MAESIWQIFMLQKELEMEVKKEKRSMEVGRENRVLEEQKACWVPETGSILMLEMKVRMFKSLTCFLFPNWVSLLKFQEAIHAPLSIVC